MQRVAFFDIDGTLFRSSLLIELVRILIEEGAFPAKAAQGFAGEEQAWRTRTGTYEAYIQALIATYLAHIKGVHYGAVADAAAKLTERKQHEVYRYTRDLLKRLHDEQYYIVAISQSPKTVLDVFCRQLPFAKVYGRMYEIGPQDRFTGAITDVHLIENKANIVKRVFEQNPTLTREESIAVGDTEGDISLLESVAHPICFNPNQTLFQHAKRMKWEVVVERKDVIYYL